MAPAALASLFSPSFFYPSKPNNNPPLLSLHSITPMLCINSSQSNALASEHNSAFFLHELGLAKKQVTLLFHTHPQLQFTAPQPLVVKLQSLKITGVALHRAIARRPDILTSPEVLPFLDFLREEITGLRPEKLERLLVSTRPRLFTGFSERVQLLLDHGIPKEKLGHVLNNVNISKVFCEMPLTELDELLLFLQRFGLPDIVLRRPVLLNLDLRTQMIPRVDFFIDLADGDEAAAAAIIRKLPGILAYTVEHFGSHLNFWQSVGLTREQVFKVALVYPNVFSVSRERKLKPRIEFLAQCNLNAEDIFRFLVKAPTFLSLSLEKNLSKKLSFLVKIGYKHRTRELASAVGAATRTSCENMQMVIALFLGHGFSCEDVLTMSKKHPQILQYNYESLEKKMEFLIEEMERDIGELIAFPAFLGYKLDDRIKLRYEVKKESRGKGMSLNKLLSVSTKKFN